MVAASRARLPVDLHHPFHGHLHMRYARFDLSGGGERLFIFERGLDMANPRDGMARGDSYVLEFARVPKELATLISRGS